MCTWSIPAHPIIFLQFLRLNRGFLFLLKILDGNNFSCPIPRGVVYTGACGAEEHDQTNEEELDWYTLWTVSIDDDDVVLIPI